VDTRKKLDVPLITAAVKLLLGLLNLVISIHRNHEALKRRQASVKAALCLLMPADIPCWAFFTGFPITLVTAEFSTAVNFAAMVQGALAV